jgi:hypothetical protein
MTGSGDPVVALEKENALFAPMLLTDLNRMTKGTDGAIPVQFGIAKLPGTKSYYDSETRNIETIKSNEPNRIPYLIGRLVGCVPKTSTNATAAFDLLGILGGNEGSSIIAANPEIGSGVCRLNLLDEQQKTIWYAYGLNSGQTTALMQAIKSYASSDIMNPVVAPRGPNLNELMNSLEKNLRSLVAGQSSPAAAMTATQNQWLEIEKANGPDINRARRADMRENIQ